MEMNSLFRTLLGKGKGRRGSIVIRNRGLGNLFAILIQKGNAKGRVRSIRFERQAGRDLSQPLQFQQKLLESQRSISCRLNFKIVTIRNGLEKCSYRE